MMRTRLDPSNMLPLAIDEDGHMKIICPVCRRNNAAVISLEQWTKLRTRDAKDRQRCGRPRDDFAWWTSWSIRRRVELSLGLPLHAASTLLSLAHASPRTDSSCFEVGLRIIGRLLMLAMLALCLSLVFIKFAIYYLTCFYERLLVHVVDIRILPWSRPLSSLVFSGDN